MQLKVRQFLYVVLAMSLSLCFFLATAGVTYAQNFNGGHLGYTLGTANYNVGLSHDLGSRSARFLNYHLDSISVDGFSYGMIGGYGRVQDKTYFGIEGNFEYTKADHEWNAGGISSDYEQIKVEESFGICARLGHVVNNWLVYGLLGWQVTNINAELEYGTKLFDDKNFNGIRTGIGVEYQTSENIFFRYEYSYTTYWEETLSGNNIKIKVDPNAKNSQLVYGVRF